MKEDERPISRAASGSDTAGGRRNGGNEDVTNHRPYLVAWPVMSE
jgi:hypothetical protein